MKEESRIKNLEPRTKSQEPRQKIINNFIIMQLINSQTKIIATLGPASATKEIIHKMILEGVDVFRLNFSHSTQAEHLKLIHIIQDLNLEFETHVSILADLRVRSSG